MLRSEAADIIEGSSQGPYSQSQHSQLDAIYTSQRSSSRCKVCENDTFYEDSNANFVCTVCGTQVEDYIVESFEEDFEQLKASERLSLKRLSGIHANIKKEKVQKVQEVQSNTLDLLSALQFCLKLLAEEIYELSCVDGLVAEVRKLWFEYLNVWKSSGHEITGYFSNLMAENEEDRNHHEISKDDSEGSSRSDSSDDDDDDDDDDTAMEEQTTEKRNVRFSKSVSKSIPPSSSSQVAYQPLPVLPSRNLLLGLISLAARNLKSWLQPHDILFWIQNGMTSYNCFLQRMPPKIKVSKYCRYVFNQPGDGKRLFPSPSNVLYHMCAIADTLGRPMPSLNVVAVARACITKLGFPAEVWQKYVDISQLFTLFDPLPELETLHFASKSAPSPLASIRHVEDVMASIIIAVRMTNNWMDWIYSIAPDASNVMIPTSTSMLKSLPRKHLGQVLKQIEKLVPKYEPGAHDFMFNNVVDKCLKELAGTQSQNSDSSNSSTCTNRRGRDVLVNNENACTELETNPIAIAPLASPHFTQEIKSKFDELNGKNITISEPDYLRMHNRNLRNKTLTYERVSACFHLTKKKAAEELGVDCNTLDRHLQQLGIHSWPKMHKYPKKTKKPSSTSERDSVEKSKFLTYVQQEDETGTPHPQYTTLLLRCALHIQMDASLLHYLVEKIDKNIVNFVNYFSRQQTDDKSHPFRRSLHAAIFEDYYHKSDKNRPKARVINQMPLSGSLRTDPTSLFLRNPEVEGGIVAIPYYFNGNVLAEEEVAGADKVIRAVEHGKKNSSLDLKYRGGKVRMKVTDWATESRQLSFALTDDKGRSKGKKRRISTGVASKSSATSSTSCSSSVSGSDFGL